MAIRREIRNFNNPMLQKAMLLNEQRNANAAIKGMLNRNLYGNYAAREGAREVEGAAFGRSHALAKRTMADKQSRHTQSYGAKARSIKDAKRGANIATILGLGSLGVTWQGNRDASKQRVADKKHRLLMEKYFLNAQKRIPQFTGGAMEDFYYGGNPNIT